MRQIPIAIESTEQIQVAQPGTGIEQADPQTTLRQGDPDIEHQITFTDATLTTRDGNHQRGGCHG